MDDDLISRQALIDALTHFTNLSWDKLKIIFPMLTVVEDMPSAERRGRWIDMGDFEQCSVCHGTHLKVVQTYYGEATWVKTPYCPNCGARMDLEDE